MSRSFDEVYEMINNVYDQTGPFARGPLNVKEVYALCQISGPCKEPSLNILSRDEALVLACDLLSKEKKEGEDQADRVPDNLLNNDDPVNKPSHYTFGNIEVIDYIRDKLSMEEFLGFCEGNVLKYVSRWRHKGGVEDLKKARVYLDWMIERHEVGRK